MVNNSKLLIDGIRSVIGGMHSGIDTILLTVVQAAFLINVMVRGGFAETRFGYKERGLDFENDEHTSTFEDDLFQGAEFFDPTGKDPMLIASVGGRIWKIDVENDYAVSDITPVAGTTVIGAATTVTWTNVVGASLVGNVVTKTAADGAWDAGAFSNQSIAAGNGYVEFTPAQADKHVMIGFGDETDAGQNYLELLYAIYLTNAAFIEVHESGAMKLTAVPYVITDVFRIEIAGGVVVYKKNGVIFYTSAAAPTYPLYVDTSIFSNGGIISGVQLFSALFISPPVGSDLTINVADTSQIHVGYPVIIQNGRYMVTAKTLTSITATNLDATAGVNIPYDTPVYYLLPNPSLLPKTWMLQAEGYFLIQNGLDGCIIYDGSTARRAVRNGLKLEVPTGTAMAYWQGRIWVAVNKREIEAGDIFGGPTTILDFTETTYLAEGGKFRVPSGAGDITALKVLPVLDQALGQGPLQVHTRTSISTLNLPVNRDRWKDIDQPVQPLVGLGYGATSDWSTQPVNTDIFLRANDGLRSVRMGRQDQAGTWSNTPISKEMNRVLENDDEKFLQYSSAVVFRNLLLFTVNPLPFNSGRAAYWRGLGVLDFDPISGMGSKSPPVYAGLWQGVNIMQIVKGTFHQKERCFLFVRNAENKNELWEVDPTSRFDGEAGQIRCRIESRGMDMNKNDTLHNLQSAVLRIDRLEGTANFRLQYRPDGYGCWIPWGNQKTRCATTRVCDPTTETVEGFCYEPTTKQPGYLTKIGWGQPEDTCEPFDKKLARVGYVHEFALEFDGAVRIKMLRIKANEEAESAHPGDVED